MEADAYFVALGDNRYRPTSHAGGAWSPGEIHFGPLGGLIAHAIERHVERTGVAMQPGRISFDILGFLAAQEITIAVTTVRPGRTIELVEATAEIDGRAAVRARAWFLAAFDTSAVAGGADDALIPPEDTPAWPMGSVWPGGFVASLEARSVTEPTPGRAVVWLTTQTRLVEGEEAGAFARWMGLVDAANGIAVRCPPGEWLFPNVDLTVHLHRPPTGRWVGLDTRVVFGAGGLGVTSSVLHDISGAVGTAQQSLTVRPVNLGS